jgi:hypothetical protein
VGVGASTFRSLWAASARSPAKEEEKKSSGVSIQSVATLHALTTGMVMIGVWGNAYSSRIQSVRYGPRWVYFQWRALPCPQADGGE